jgi:hypothetical protein
VEPQIVRTDPVLDNRPEPSGSGSQRLVYVLLWAIGLILITLGAYAMWRERQSWLPEVCVALGVAVATPGGLSYLYRKYMLEDIKLELQKPAIEFKRAAVDMMSQALSDVTGTYRSELDLLRSTQVAGIRGVFVSRGDALAAFMPALEAERHEIMLVGSSLRGLVQDYDNEYERIREVLKRKIQHKVRVRILLTHPVMADLRAKQEDRNPKDIGREIIQSLRVLCGEWNLDPANVRLYLGTPTLFGIKTADTMLLNTYPYMKEAVASPCMIVTKPGYMYDRYADSHFRAWSSAMAVRPPEDPKVLLKNLDSYAGQVTALLTAALQFAETIPSDESQGNGPQTA